MTETQSLNIGYRAAALKPPLFLSAAILATILYAACLTVYGVLPLLAPVLLVFLVPAAIVIVPLSLRAVWRTVRGRPLLTLDATAVTLHSGRISVPWSGLAEIRITRTLRKGRQTELLVFVPADPERILAGLRGFPRWFARDAIRRFGGPIFLRSQDLLCPVGEIVAAARPYTAAPVNRRTALGGDLPRSV